MKPSLHFFGYNSSMNCKGSMHADIDLTDVKVESIPSRLMEEFNEPGVTIVINNHLL